jgi:hypothetical protein
MFLLGLLRYSVVEVNPVQLLQGDCSKHLILVYLEAEPAFSSSDFTGLIISWYLSFGHYIEAGMLINPCT